MVVAQTKQSSTSVPHSAPLVLLMDCRQLSVSELSEAYRSTGTEGFDVEGHYSRLLTYGRDRWYGLSACAWHIPLTHHLQQATSEQGSQQPF